MEQDTLIRVQQEDFDMAALTEALHAGRGQVGAVVTFMGLVRDLSGDPLRRMVLEHYPGMTESALAEIVQKARKRWPLGAVTVVHRVGELAPGDRIVYVGVASAHREAAFAAASFIMDFLKRDAPFWKKEITASGERWVEQKESDLERVRRWE